jgi:small subunit ribosomal protein S1
VQVLEVDPAKRRISLGLKQTLDNPWQAFASSHPVGSQVEGEVKNKTEFGLFIGLEGDVDGMVHLSDLDWTRPGEQVIEEYNRGDMVKAQVLDVDIDKERISLGIKQLANDPFEKVNVVAKKGDVVTVIVAGIQDNGIDVTVQDGIPGFIRKSELSRDRSEQRPDRYAVGDKLDAKITNIDKASRRVVLSVKARELDEEKKAMADFGSSDSGASLGDILGAALRKKAEGEEE